ncbi:hypothetical protein VNO78_21908 [Psophocarpus tetragonolobus]|uniref:Uncharacterized protein n=1 Tax=Psophocarpus tetragonolobus TaxID=3891 RepID=A0AAN9XIF5_PSOTE
MEPPESTYIYGTAMNPEVKVRAPEQEEEFVYPENNSGSWMFSKLIELLYFEAEEKNRSECAPSISKSKKACPQHVTMRSTSSTKGLLKSIKRVGESPKETGRACSVIRPRAVLSSPENDGLIGRINDLNNSISSTLRKKDARGKIEGEAKVMSNKVKEEKYFDSEKESEAFNKGKTPFKAKVHVRNF